MGGSGCGLGCALGPPAAHMHTCYTQHIGVAPLGKGVGITGGFSSPTSIHSIYQKGGLSYQVGYPYLLYLLWFGLFVRHPFSFSFVLVPEGQHLCSFCFFFFFRQLLEVPHEELLFL
jgi:hypothetical protein